RQRGRREEPRDPPREHDAQPAERGGAEEHGRDAGLRAPFRGPRGGGGPGGRPRAGAGQGLTPSGAPPARLAHEHPRGGRSGDVHAATDDAFWDIGRRNTGTENPGRTASCVTSKTGRTSTPS